MNEKEFRQFPKSIQLAQRSMIMAIAIPLTLRFLLRVKARWIFATLWGAVAACAIVSLMATYYAVIRYPYIGLVDAKDGDLYSKYLGGLSPLFQKLLKILSIIALSAIVIAPVMDQRVTPRDLVVMLYFGTILGFVLFLTFSYDRFLHPTVATFLRCSLGVGIVFVPIFLPAILIGSVRAKNLLDRAEAEL